MNLPEAVEILRNERDAIMADDPDRDELDLCSALDVALEYVQNGYLEMPGPEEPLTEEEWGQLHRSLNQAIKRGQSSLKRLRSHNQPQADPDFVEGRLKWMAGLLNKIERHAF